MKSEAFRTAEFIKESETLALMLEQAARELRAGAWSSFTWNEDFARPETREGFVRRIVFEMRLENSR